MDQETRDFQIQLSEYKGMRYGVLNLMEENDYVTVRSAFRQAMEIVKREEIQFGILKRTIDLNMSTAIRTYQSEWMLRELPSHRFHLALVFKKKGRFEQFVEAILLNRMHNVRIFANIPDAVEWLYSIYETNKKEEAISRDNLTK
jgi:hypothetical protein